MTGIADPQAVTGLTASTLYNVQTRAVNAVGAGAWSASGSATTDAPASADSFFEDWTDGSYTVGDEVADLSNWNGLAALTTASETASLFDNGGTTMLRANTSIVGNRAFIYAGSATLGADRKITVTLDQIGSSGFLSLLIYLHYIDANEFVNVGVNASGAVLYRAKTGGVMDGDWDRFGEPVTNSSVITISIDGGQTVVTLDGVQKGPTRTLTWTPTLSQPIIVVRNDTSNTIIESINLETLP